jgi:hypothetical protein
MNAWRNMRLAEERQRERQEAVANGTELELLVKQAFDGETIAQFELKQLVKREPELKGRVNELIWRLAGEPPQKS